MPRGRTRSQVVRGAAYSTCSSGSAALAAVLLAVHASPLSQPAVAQALTAKLSRNSSSEGRRSDQAMGVCTAVMTSCPKSMHTSLNRVGRDAGCCSIRFQRLHARGRDSLWRLLQDDKEWCRSEQCPTASWISGVAAGRNRQGLRPGQLQVCKQGRVHSALLLQVMPFRPCKQQHLLCPERTESAARHRSPPRAHTLRIAHGRGRAGILIGYFRQHVATLQPSSIPRTALLTSRLAPRDGHAQPQVPCPERHLQTL